jgi:predicted nucleic acid-binding protein
VDAHLLASALLDRVRLWTLDRRLDRVARQLRVAWPA